MKNKVTRKCKEQLKVAKHHKSHVPFSNKQTNKNVTRERGGREDKTKEGSK
jgi:hypothetical protein